MSCTIVAQDWNYAWTNEPIWEIQSSVGFAHTAKIAAGLAFFDLDEFGTPLGWLLGWRPCLAWPCFWITSHSNVLNYFFFFIYLYDGIVIFIWFHLVSFCSSLFKSYGYFPVFFFDMRLWAWQLLIQCWFSGLTAATKLFCLSTPLAWVRWHFDSVSLFGLPISATAFAWCC